MTLWYVLVIVYMVHMVLSAKQWYLIYISRINISSVNNSPCDIMTSKKTQPKCPNIAGVPIMDRHPVCYRSQVKFIILILNPFSDLPHYHSFSTIWAVHQTPKISQIQRIIVLLILGLCKKSTPIFTHWHGELTVWCRPRYTSYSTFPQSVSQGQVTLQIE